MRRTIVSVIGFLQICMVAAFAAGQYFLAQNAPHPLGATIGFIAFDLMVLVPAYLMLTGTLPFRIKG